MSFSACSSGSIWSLDFFKGFFKVVNSLYIKEKIGYPI
jgi:hypothetical protein